MADYDFSAPRLYLDAALAAGAVVALEHAQQNYLRNVLRLNEGENVLVFNGRDGEWQAQITPGDRRKQMSLVALLQVRPQTQPTNLHYLFAPLKHARLDYMVQKAVEMGVGSLRPVMTRRTQSTRVNIERMRANVVEAAEQCGILSIADVQPTTTLDTVLRDWPRDRLLVFCDEDAPVSDPVQALSTAAPAADGAAVLIGPEGGFDPSERSTLLAIPRLVRLSLGRRILRADTAAVAALALVQSTLGDWRSSSPA